MQDQFEGTTYLKLIYIYIYAHLLACFPKSVDYTTKRCQTKQRAYGVEDKFCYFMQLYLRHACMRSKQSIKTYSSCGNNVVLPVGQPIRHCFTSPVPVCRNVRTVLKTICGLTNSCEAISL